MSSTGQRPLRKLPSVEALLQDPELQAVDGDVPRSIVVDAVRDSVQQTRQTLLASGAEEADEEQLRREILDRACHRIRSARRPHYCRVVNATGVILHTALGRAVLPERAIRQIVEETSGYSLVQADPETGRRAARDAKIQSLLQKLTGAPAATVVNNNAAATSIVLNTVAEGREVIVSRGQLVEIGGAFRLPDVMAACGTKLVEVGTTNKTHPRDYETAITENTAAIMRVHPSNYRISGFTAEVPVKTLAGIARKHNLVLIDDVGAGPLIDFSQFGFEHEPTLQESVKAGADLITCSADKLIGACQGGIILGRKDLVQAVRKNPLTRIVRVGKLTFAALEATLSLLLDHSLALREIPTLRMLQRQLPDLTEQADRIAAAIRAETDIEVETAEGFSQMGSGSLPTQNLPTRLVTLCATTSKPDEISTQLRRCRPPVFTRIHKELVIIDPRTLLDDEEPELVRAVIQVMNQAS